MKYAVVVLATMLGTVSCAEPRQSAKAPVEAPVIRPDEVVDFNLLYRQNCSGCHGADGQGGLSVGIGRPEYLAIADDAVIRRVVEEGRPGTAMQGFAQQAGGMLTDGQIQIIVHGIRKHWAGRAQPGTLDTANIPAYAAAQPGDAGRGHIVFAASCSPCHGTDGRGARAIADSSFLALVSDQYLRTVTIVGMPHLGMPDWRSHNKRLSDAEVTDVVAWLAAQRQQPLSAQLSH